MEETLLREPCDPLKSHCSHEAGAKKRETRAGLMTLARHGGEEVSPVSDQRHSFLGTFLQTSVVVCMLSPTPSLQHT